MDDQAGIHRGRRWTAREKVEQDLAAEVDEALAMSLAERYEAEIGKASDG